jgi:hypothetical protein
LRRFASFVALAALVMLSSVAASADPPNITGKWIVQQSGLNGQSGAKISLIQSGNGIVGQNNANGNGFTGTFVTDAQINGKWHGPSGAGWLTVYVTPNGHSFNGTWGYNGKPANGSFVGNKILPPVVISAAGTWNVTVVGGPHIFGGVQSCTESNGVAACSINRVVINGKFTTPDKVTAKWHGPNGAGWYSFWFNSDGQSFNGVWGFNGRTKEEGRVVGQRA